MLTTKLKARKHLAACLATGACALATALPANASLTFDFSFDLTSGGPGPSIGTVTGTISGLQDDTADQTTGLTISNLSAPNTPSDGWPPNFNYFNGTGISVAGGNVTGYDIQFNASGLDLGQGSLLRLSDSGQIALNYFDVNQGIDIFNEGLTATFTPQSGPAPVPGPLPILGAGAAFGWSRRLRRRLKVVTDAS